MWGVKSLNGFVKGFATFMTAVGAGGLYAPGVQNRWRREDFRRNPVTQDRERHARTQGLIAADRRLALAGPTLAWVAAAAEVMGGFTQPGALTHIRCPIVVLSAEREMLVDNAAHARVLQGLPTGQGVIVAGAKHEIMMETDAVRAVFWGHFDALATKALAGQAA
jgi:lysophospholipase